VRSAPLAKAKDASSRSIGQSNRPPTSIHAHDRKPRGGPGVSGEQDGALGALAAGKYWLGLGVEGLRTLAFLVIVFGNQATTYTNRTRQRLWSIRPGAWLVRSSIADLLIASTLANRGIAMTPLPALVMGGAFAGAILLALVADMVKVRSFVV
jgi:H+-transporting ATPase